MWTLPVVLHLHSKIGNTPVNFQPSFQGCMLRGACLGHTAYKAVLPAFGEERLAFATKEGLVPSSPLFVSTSVFPTRRGPLWVGCSESCWEQRLSTWSLALIWPATWQWKTHSPSQLKIAREIIMLSWGQIVGLVLQMSTHMQRAITVHWLF